MRDSTLNKIDKNLYQRYGKRLIDVILSLTAIIFLSPLLIIVGLFVKIKLGSPILFKQPRPGKKEKIFFLIKYRSMNDLKDENGDLLPDNMRLTTFGKFLRKSSLDELPELFNILKGEMSFIGPRPLSIFYLPYYTEEERVRHQVLPGLTGLAQINGRNNSNWDQKLKYDLSYEKNISFINDLKIFFKTISKVLRQSDVSVRNNETLKNFNVWKKVREESAVSNLIKPDKEIGSDFHLVQPSSKEDITIDDFLTKGNFKDFQYTFSGRSAIAQVIEDVSIKKEIKTAYLPSYACISMLQPFLDKKITIKFYDVVIENNRFQYHFDKNIDTDIVLFMEYFGFHTCDKSFLSFLNEERKQGVTIVQDITHTLFNKDRFNILSDYYVGSIRKWCAIPSGGIAYKIQSNFEMKTSEDSNTAVVSKLAAMREKSLYLSGEDISKNDFLKRNADFNNSLIRLDESLKIDDYSKRYLKEASVSMIIKSRKKNAEFIYNTLNTRDLFVFPFDSKELDSVVPLFVPIIVKNLRRDELRKKLISNQIYLPVHWSEEFGADASIKRKELSLVCDQRYDVSDLRRMVDMINEWGVVNS